MRYLIILFVSLTLLTGCAPLLPDRATLVSSDIPSHDPNKGRVFFYLGHAKQGFMTGDLNNGGLGYIYIDNKKVSYMSSHATVVLDLPQGNYKVEWGPPLWFEADKDHFQEISYELTVKAGGIVFLEANTTFVESTAGGALGLLGGAVGGAIAGASSHIDCYFKSQPEEGLNRSRELRIVDYVDLSSL